jgi:alpha-glucoside transport system permease protein
MTAEAQRAEAPAPGPPPESYKGSLWERYGVTALFLAPALVLLAVWVVYPTISTIRRSFYDREGSSFVGLDNYETLFTDDTLTTAIRNNFLWLLIVPAFVTALGLVFAVLLERVRFSTAFKVAVFMPMAISLFAAGVIWRLMYEKDPDQGTVNAAVAVVKDAVSPSGVLSNARPSTEALQGGPEGGLELTDAIQPGDVASSD